MQNEAMRMPRLFRKLLSRFEYVARLKRAVGKAYALADIVGVHSCECEDSCLYKSAIEFMETNKEFEGLAYEKDEWKGA